MSLPTPAAMVTRARALYRSAEKSLARQAGARALLAAPRTVRFALRSLFGDASPGGEARSVTPTPSLLAHVAMDETILAVAMAPNRFPRRAEYERVAAEVAEARELFSDRGWLADPASYHKDPPPLRGGVVTTRGWALGLPYERIHFESGFEARPEEPGAGRWAEVRPNQTAVATVLLSSGRPPALGGGVARLWDGVSVYGLRRPAGRVPAPAAGSERRAARVANAWTAEGDATRRRAVPVVRSDERGAWTGPERLGCAPHRVVDREARAFRHRSVWGLAWWPCRRVGRGARRTVLVRDGRGAGVGLRRAAQGSQPPSRPAALDRAPNPRRPGGDGPPGRVSVAV